MFAKLKQFFQAASAEEEVNDQDAAEKIETELSALETGLQQNPADNDIKKQLMVKYNQAVKIYSASKHYRGRVDNLFIKMDELRNTIRRNI